LKVFHHFVGDGGSGPIGGVSVSSSETDSVSLADGLTVASAGPLDSMLLILLSPGAALDPDSETGSV